MSKERLIQPVNNMDEKYQTYKRLKGRHTAAIKGEFYLEAILIDYALAEDRLRSFLYYIGLLENRSAVRGYKKCSSYLNPIIEQYKNKKYENGRIGVKNIGDKIKIVRCCALWSTEYEDDYTDKYLTALKTGFENVDIQYLLDLLGDLEKWKEYRNEIIHALMNKNIDSLDEGIAEKAIEGRRLAEQIDNQLRMFKKGNYPRKALNLQNN